MCVFVCVCVCVCVCVSALKFKNVLEKSVIVKEIARVLKRQTFSCKREKNNACV